MPTFFQELSGGPRGEDLLSSLRSGPPPTVQKSQDVIAGISIFPIFLLLNYSLHIITQI